MLIMKKIPTDIDYAKALDYFIRHAGNYFKAHRLHAAVLGISGGIDSTVVAYIMHRTAGKLRSEGWDFTFVGISMPTETTAGQEFDNSNMVGRAFCDNFSVLDIGAEARAIAIPEAGHSTDPLMQRKRAGNIKSRLRMIHLYDLAKAWGGLVVGTDNYTEYHLGYSTIGGDALFDYCPIQALWKTEIYGLAEHFLSVEKAEGHEDAVRALQASIDIAPQAGLGISTNDCEEIGAPDYFVIDRILYNHVHNLPQDEDLAPEVIRSVTGLYDRNLFKKDLPVTISREELR